MADTSQEQHRNSVERFIALANTIKDEGVPIDVVSAGLMTASGVYATFIVGGNDGGLTASGVDKVAAKYKQELEHIQEVKKAQNAQQSED